MGISFQSNHNGTAGPWRQRHGDMPGTDLGSTSFGHHRHNLVLSVATSLDYNRTGLQRICIDEGKRNFFLRDSFNERRNVFWKTWPSSNGIEVADLGVDEVGAMARTPWVIPTKSKMHQRRCRNGVSTESACHTGPAAGWAIIPYQ